MPRIKLVELPAFKLLDGDGYNWTALRRLDPLGSKQIIAAHLEQSGFDVHVENLKACETETELGEVRWRDKNLTKIAVGKPWTQLDPSDADVWGVTVNYLQERDVSCSLIHYLSEGGGKVVVGGSDAFAEPEPYLAAGAVAVIKDKSGGANVSVIDYALGVEPREPLAGVVLPNGESIKARRPPMQPEDWPLPSPHHVQQTMGRDYWECPLPDELKPVGAVMLDIGCDRNCDFCETPTYKVGYKWMSPQRALKWVERQRDQGAKSVIVLSDQFLGRVLWKNGRDEVLEIMKGFRELGVAALWGNGIEVHKATRGRSLPNGDPAPDDELVEALWGWDGKVGCGQTYIPAERPLSGPKDYQKLLPWQHHCQMMREIVSVGVPDITYGVIVGLPEDSHDQLQRLYDGVAELRSELKSINPELAFRVVPYAIRPIPGTPQSNILNEMNLIRFSDPAILGGFWTACADTMYLDYEEVSDWQHRLSFELSDYEPGFQGITAITTGA